MTWGELKRVVEAAGVKDEDTIEVFDRKMFDELMSLHQSMSDYEEDGLPPDILAEHLDWVDLLTDRFLVGRDSSDAIGWNGNQILLRPPVAFRDEDGVIDVYYTSLVPTESRSWS